MRTRKQYMDGEVSHEDYFAQFVTDRIRNVVLLYIGKGAIRESLDEHFNDIPLHLWDRIYLRNHGGKEVIDTLGISPLFQETGEIVSQSVMVCVLKAAARQIKAEVSK